MRHSFKAGGVTKILKLDDTRCRQGCGLQKPSSPGGGSEVCYSHSREQSGRPQPNGVSLLGTYIPKNSPGIHKEACAKPLLTTLFAGQCGGDSPSFDPGEWMSHTKSRHIMENFAAGRRYKLNMHIVTQMEPSPIG